MPVLEDQLRDAEGRPVGEQVRDDAERGDQRRLQRDEQEQEAEREHDADHERRLRAERRLEVVVLGDCAADERAPAGASRAQPVDGRRRPPGRRDPASARPGRARARRSSLGMGGITSAMPGSLPACAAPPRPPRPAGATICSAPGAPGPKASCTWCSPAATGRPSARPRSTACRCRAGRTGIGERDEHRRRAAAPKAHGRRQSRSAQAANLPRAVLAGVHPRQRDPVHLGPELRQHRRAAASASPPARRSPRA